MPTEVPCCDVNKPYDEVVLSRFQPVDEIAKKLSTQVISPCCNWLVFCAAFSILQFWSGCSSDNGNMSTLPYSGAIVSNECAESVVLDHDFGVIKGGNLYEHEFEIHNDTKIAWSLDRLINSCACTATSVSSQVIQPGTTERIKVGYKSQERSYNDERNVAVVFKESNAPQFVLKIRARVRVPMTISPDKLVFPQLGKGQQRKDSFEIYNFSEADWDSIHIESSTNWLSTNWSAVPVRESDRGIVRQSWCATVTADAGDIPSGQHDGTIVIRSIGGKGKEYLNSLKVHALVTSAVTAIPSQLFFGRIKPGETADTTVKIQFSPGSTPKDLSKIAFKHNFGDQLNLRWLKTDGDVWELNAELTLRDGEELSGQKLSVAFSESGLPSLDLPIYVFSVTKKRDLEVK